MNAVFEQPSPWSRVRRVFAGFDGPLTLAIAMLATIGLVSMYSAGYDHGTRFVDHGRNMLIALAVLFAVAQVPPQRLQQAALPLYVVGVVLLLLIEIPGLGITKKGATRWLDVGIVIQPSEMLKIAVPLMLAWWFQKREGQLRVPDFVVGGLLLALPVGLVMHQPDLGTSLPSARANHAAWAVTAVPSGRWPCTVVRTAWGNARAPAGTKGCICTGAAAPEAGALAAGTATPMRASVAARQ